MSTDSHCSGLTYCQFGYALTCSKIPSSPTESNPEIYYKNSCNIGWVSGCNFALNKGSKIFLNIS